VKYSPFQHFTLNTGIDFWVAYLLAEIRIQPRLSKTETVIHQAGQNTQRFEWVAKGHYTIQRLNHSAQDVKFTSKYLVSFENVRVKSEILNGLHRIRVGEHATIFTCWYYMKLWHSQFHRSSFHNNKFSYGKMSCSTTVLKNFIWI